MKKFWLVIVLIFLLFGVSGYAEDGSFGLNVMCREQLEKLYDDIKIANDTYHEPDTLSKAIALEYTQMEVEKYFRQQGIEVSWAWIDYTYTKNWDFYTILTHIDYENKEGSSKSSDVYAEVFPQNGDWAVYYLTVGEEEIINHRTEIPDVLWEKTPDTIMNQDIGLDLAVMTEEQLDCLKEDTKEEIERNHKPKASISELLLSMTKVEVEQYFENQGYDVSWAWFDYTYEREWDLYSLTTPIDYENENGRNQAVVYAEAYPENGRYALCYLKIDENVILDDRERIPQNVVELVNASQGEITPMPISTEEPIADLKEEQRGGGETNKEEKQDYITTANCSEFAVILKARDEFDPCIAEFSEKYRDKTIEFDASIRSIFNHGDYTTRFDILLTAGNFDPNHMSGPYFQFRDVNTFDMGINELFLSDFMNVGDHVHVIAEVKRFEEKSGLFILKPILVTLRNEEEKSNDLNEDSTLKLGCKGEEVLAARQKLYELGYFKKKPTQMEYTRNMMEYVKMFEKDYGLEQDGVLSVEDQKILFGQ